MNKGKKNKPINNNVKFFLISFTVMMAVIIAISWLNIDISREDSKPYDFPIILLFMFIGIFINTNLHEFGHFVTGKALGYRILSYRVGVFAWNYENGRYKFSLMRTKGYGGLCAFVPPDRQTKLNTSLMYLAGCVVNIISGIIFIFIGSLLTSYFLSIFFIIVGGVGIFLGITNLIPLEMMSMSTDGKIVFGILFNRPYAKALMKKQMLLSQLTLGIRPRDIQLEFDDDSYNDPYMIILEYFKALDYYDLESMNRLAQLMEDNLDLVSGFALPGYYNEIIFVASINNDALKAKTFYDKASKILNRDMDINGCRVKAYYEYYINNDLNKAKELIDNGLKVWDKFPIKGQALMEKQLLINLAKTIEQ